jgi:very-short-patch-repair endonuclease
MKAKARDLRKNPTDAEKLLWYNLRNRRLAGYKFRRQNPIGPFFADFACIEKTLQQMP